MYKVFSKCSQNQLNISKFLPPKRHKTVPTFLLIETKLHQFSRFVLIVWLYFKNQVQGE